MKDDFDLTDEEKRNITESIKSRPLTFHRTVNQSINETTGCVELDRTKVTFLASNNQSNNQSNQSVRQSLLNAIIAYHWCEKLHPNTTQSAITLSDQSIDSVELTAEEKSQLDSLQLDLDYQSVNQSIKQSNNQTSSVVISVDPSINSLPSSLNDQTNKIKFVQSALEQNQTIDQINQSIKQFVVDLPDLLSMI